MTRSKTPREALERQRAKLARAHETLEAALADIEDTLASADSEFGWANVSIYAPLVEAVSGYEDTGLFGMTEEA